MNQIPSVKNKRLRRAIYPGNVLAEQGRSQTIPVRVQYHDGPLFAKHLATPGVESRDLINLPNYHMFVRLMLDGQQTKAFSATTLA